MVFRNAAYFAVIALGVLFAAGLVAIAFMPTQPIRQDFATVTAITNQASQWAAKVTVTYRTQDGLLGAETFSARSLDCHVGDVVPVDREGVSVSLRAKACRKAT